MADFRTHASWGAAVAAAVAGGAFGAGLTQGTPGAFTLLAVSVLVGSMAPDIDSDSGVPFHVTFGALSVLSAGAVAFVLLALFPGNWLRALGWSLVAAVVIWAGVGTLFKRFTRHRGMAHSIPAAALGAMATFAVAGLLKAPDTAALLAGVGFGLGYLLHLALDEVYATVDIEGRRLAPKKSLGSALKLSSNRPVITVAVYAAIGMLVVWNYDRLGAATRALTGLIG
jgi:membrane-bound metal-dependent hydrolase YbcI (DUF457 family)